jgi:hypothetical protein
LKWAGLGALLGMLALAVGCGARSDPNAVEDSSAGPLPAPDNPSHTKGIERVCSVELALSCSPRKSREDCYAVIDQERSDAISVGCGKAYDALLVCWATHGARCELIGAVWNDGCQAMESAFDSCKSG